MNSLIRLVLAILVTAWLALTGCAQQRRYSFETAVQHTVAEAVPSADDPRRLAMFAGHDGRPLGWNDLLDAAAWADVIILGELHNDAMAHAVQLAVAQDVFARWPNSAVSMEMLERNEQTVVDDYLDGIIDAQTLATLTHSQNWAGKGSWQKWYQPVIDVAKDAGGTVVAANAPRQYVRAARTEGYGRLRKLPDERRRLFDLPAKLWSGRYRARFLEVMTPEDGDAAHSVESSQMDAAYRSQLLWDATMAASIARAKRSGADKVIHLVGQFHSDFEGGTVLELRRRLPRARILTISMQATDASALQEEDRGRADIVIYTGKPPEDPESEADEESAD